MVYENSTAIIRTLSENKHIAGCVTVTTYNYQKAKPNQFVYDGYMCDKFEIKETVGGKLVITTFEKLHFSGIEITNRILISNVTKVEILTEHKI